MRDRTMLSQLLGDACGNMSIHQCERIAKDMVQAGVKPEEITFELVGPKDRKQCSWLDPYLGFFQVEGMTGFLRVVDIEMHHDLHVENLSMEAAEAVKERANG